RRKRPARRRAQESTSRYAGWRTIHLFHLRNSSANLPRFHHLQRALLVSTPHCGAQPVSTTDLTREARALPPRSSGKARRLFQRAVSEVSPTQDTSDSITIIQESLGADDVFSRRRRGFSGC